MTSIPSEVMQASARSLKNLRHTLENTRDSTHKFRCVLVSYLVSTHVSIRRLHKLYFHAARQEGRTALQPTNRVGHAHQKPKHSFKCFKGFNRVLRRRGHVVSARMWLGRRDT